MRDEIVTPLSDIIIDLISEVCEVKDNRVELVVNHVYELLIMLYTNRNRLNDDISKTLSKILFFIIEVNRK